MTAYESSQLYETAALYNGSADASGRIRSILLMTPVRYVSQTGLSRAIDFSGLNRTINND